MEDITIGGKAKLAQDPAPLVLEVDFPKALEMHKSNTQVKKYLDRNPTKDLFPFDTKLSPLFDLPNPILSKEEDEDEIFDFTIWLDLDQSQACRLNPFLLY